MIMKCSVCGNEFIAERKHAKYCSAICKNHSRYEVRRTEQQQEAALKQQRAVELYYSDLTAGEIAGLIGVSSTFVYSAWKNADLSRRLTQQQKNVMRLRKQGKCSVEIADELGIRVSTVNATALAINMPFTDEDKQRSTNIARQKMVITQFGDENTRKKKYAEFISKHYPGFEYISGSINSDGSVALRCKKCGEIIQKAAVAVRHFNSPIICPICNENHKQEVQAQKEAYRREREQKKIRAFWKQGFEQISFKMCQCRECGTFFIGRTQYCSQECRRRHINRKHDKRLNRAKRIDKSISLKKLYKRDNGICWICGGRCDYGDYRRDKDGNFIVGFNYPSIDHVYPLSRGGTHEWSNVKLAHHYCNTLKNDKVVSYG